MAQNVGEKPMLMWTWPIFALFLKKITGTPINSPVGKKGQKKQLSKKLKAKAVLQVTGMPSLEGPFPVKIEPKQD